MGGSAARTAYGYRDRLRIGNNSNISRDNISLDPIENCKCFHRTDKIVIHSRASGFLFCAFIELSNRHREIERDFYIAHRCRFCLLQCCCGAVI